MYWNLLHILPTVFCRDERCATKVDLLPWICKGLQSLAYNNGFLPFEVLMDASHGMLKHYKEKLATSEKLNNRVLWGHKGALHLVSVHLCASLVTATQEIAFLVQFVENKSTGNIAALRRWHLSCSTNQVKDKSLSQTGFSKLSNFPRAFHGLQGFSACQDWFIAVFDCVVIGQM